MSKAFRSIYSAFDRYPSTKGAATHIEQSCRALFSTAGLSPGALWVLDLGDDDIAAQPAIPNGERFAVSSDTPHLLERAEHFAETLHTWISAQAPGALQVGQFRDPWSGIPMIAADNIRLLVYEVNALPSIELPCRYPKLSAAVLDKIRSMESRCLASADAIVTPSAQTRRHLVERCGIEESRIKVLPNGAEVFPPCDRPADAPASDYLLYFGALQPWQGIDTLLQAFSQLIDKPDLPLVICSSHKERAARPYHRLARQLGIADKVTWRYQLARDELQGWLQHAAVTLAPLTDTPRNVEQGCCPLKVVESLAAGTPVIASDLVVIRDLVDYLGADSRDFSTSGVQLVRPGNAAALATSIRVTLESRDLAQAAGARARSRIENQLTWKKHRDQLTAFYEALLDG